MTLTLADFEGFDLNATELYLNFFNAATRKKGERYFLAGRVLSVACLEPGRVFEAEVLGSVKHKVSLYFNEIWDSDCNCPRGHECTHAYAAVKHLLTAYMTTAEDDLRATQGEKPKLLQPVPILLSSAAPGAFTDAVRARLERKPTTAEARYLKIITQLYRQAISSGLNYRNDLNGLGIPLSGGWWDRLELYPEDPANEGEFWNYLALYLTEKLNHPIPEFLEPFTDLTGAQDKMRHHQRGQDIQRWTQTLSDIAQLAQGSHPATPGEADPAELRLCFTSSQLIFEWRRSGGEWTALTTGKMREFEARHAPQLTAEAALLWMPCWHRIQMGNATQFSYNDSWTQEQIGRWLHHPLLRPLLVDAEGTPLIFHSDPLHWSVLQPETLDGDYLFSLTSAAGEPLPKIWLTTLTRPAYYLTPLGVFTGPPLDPHLTSLKNQTSIPAQSLESLGGLRLLNRLQVAPPPRLAARTHTVPLQPGIRAEVKKPWSTQSTEYCYVDVLGASADGTQIEYWVGNGWISKKKSPAPTHSQRLIQIDRSALGGLVPPLETAGFKWDDFSQRWQLRVTKKFAEIFVLFLKTLPTGARIELGGELASFQNAEIAGKIRLQATEAEMDWFDLQVIVDVRDTTLTQAELKLLLDAKGGWVRLDKKGWRKLEFSLSREEDEELARLGLTPHELTSESQRLHTFQLADRAARKFLPEETCDRIDRRAAELQARVTPEVPASIQAEMRPYQRDGFHFLCYLATNHFGGILADDMGLGKTLQTLAWLAWLRNGGPERGAHGASTEASPPSLVVCPKSVADNWQAEAMKFFPGLKVRVWSASELTSVASLLPSADLHVLNYSQLRVVGEDLARERFQAVILDEGQYIKNPSSQTAQIARQLRATHRLILSGTPIENRLLDLWSLMSFAMPGALGSRAEFGRLYDAKDDPFARQRLAARVRPFLIRRTKSQVARDLPDRMEEDLFCTLEGEQKILYRAELKRAQALLLGVKTAAALNKERFNFLTSLLRLRQICCHPRLVKPNSKATSAKVEALLETLEPILAEGEKVLVFSQFVDLLNILRDELKSRDWRHWYLAGDTENRGDLVRDFQAAAGAGVFLISLKAGGFGLNLTAASYVVLFDPWWNPAVENQAIDRTHRIGQTRKVMAYRLLIKDSIEEKIRALQKQKSSLANDVLGEEKFSQSLSLDDLHYLLAG